MAHEDDSGYSFRSGHSDTWRDRYGGRGLALTDAERALAAALRGDGPPPAASARPAPGRLPVLPAAGEDEEGRRPCGNGQWCHAATRGEDGQWHPARSWQPFCPACRAVIASRLAELPEACVRLLMAIGDRPRTGKAVRVPPGPRELIRPEVDALTRLMGWVLGSWHERVAPLFSLSDPPDPEAVLHRPARAVAAAVAAICPPGGEDRVDALLALPPEPMTRVIASPAEALEWLAATDPAEEGRVRRSGEAVLAPRLSGLHAGREILELHLRARRVLGRVRARPEEMDGVPCQECEQFTLARAEPPSDPSRPAMRSWCSACGAVMDDEAYESWTRRYGGYAAGLPLACRRCQRAQRDGVPHSGCIWEDCACAAAGHAGPAAAALLAARRQEA